MKNKKYKITDIEHETIKGLFRIKRLRDGLIGGFVSGYHNLSQDGDCFIYDDACVYNKAEVSDDAIVCDKANVFDNASVSCKAKVKDDSHVYDNAMVSGESVIYGQATVRDAAIVWDSYVAGDVCGATELW